MEPGRFRHRIAVQRESDAKDAYGQSVGWETVSTLPADIRAISGRDFIAASAERTTVTTKIFIRYHPDIRPTRCRLVHAPPTGRGEVYRIIAALPDRHCRRLELLCEEDFQRVTGD